MEEMKNLVIQSLETRGVLGQIRAKIRSSVFKIVDEQEQRSNMGCGLKWENPSLYKISESKCGLLLAELIREFMECFKMDYSLSVFIPECSISPEKLKKEDFFYKMGLKLNLLSFFGEVPILNFIIYYFLESLANNPEKVYASFSNVNNENIEKMTDELIEKNLKAFFTMRENMNNDENLINLNNNYDPNNMNNNFENLNKNLADITEKNNEYNRASANKEKENYTFEKLSDSDLLIDNNKKTDKDPRGNKTGTNSNSNNTGANQKKSDVVFDISETSIIDEEIILEDSYERSNDKKTSSNNYNISQSGGLDGTVDSKSLEKYNYIEPVQPQNK